MYSITEWRYFYYSGGVVKIVKSYSPALTLPSQYLSPRQCSSSSAFASHVPPPPCSQLPGWRSLTTGGLVTLVIIAFLIPNSTFKSLVVGWPYMNFNDMITDTAPG